MLILKLIEFKQNNHCIKTVKFRQQKIWRPDFNPNRNIKEILEP